MRNEFTAVIEPTDDGWFVGYCLELPEANGQGQSVEDCRENLARAITLVLEHRREEGRRGVPPGIPEQTIVVAA